MADSKELEKQRIESGLVIKEGLFLRMPKYIKNFLSKSSNGTPYLSQALLVERAVVKTYGVKVPNERIELVFEKSKGTGKKK